MHETGPFLMLLPLLLAGGLLLWAAVSDVRHMIIPNWLCALLVALFVVQALLVPVVWWSHLGALFASLAVGMGLFAIGAMGGGDIKLIAAVSLWAGFDGLPLFLMIMALSGGILALLWLVLRRALRGRQAGRWRRQPVPYGVAIAVGGLVLLLDRARLWGGA